MSANQTVEDLLQVLADAKAEGAWDLVRVSEMTDEEQDYLRNLDFFDDPITDGVGCEADFGDE
jgi:hypothetical protein